MENINPIRLKIYEMMAKRGFQTRKDLAVSVNLAPWRVGEYVRGTVKRVDLDVLGRFCRALDCQPGDLLEYIPEEAE